MAEYVELGTGGAISDGTASLFAELFEESQGGALGDGIAIAFEETSFEASGGALGDGVADNAYSVVTGVGAALGGGSALDLLEATETGTGGAVGSGHAGIRADYFWHIGIDDIAVIRIDTLENNKAILRRGFSYLPTGNSNQNAPTFSGINLERLSVLSPTEANLTFIIPLDLLWNIRGTVRKDLSLLWNVGDLEPFFYRVTGKCQNLQCPPLEGLDNCEVTYQRTVQARSIDELCSTLSKLNWLWPIDKVHKLTTPIGTSNECNVFEEVEVCNNPKCADFCIKYDLVVDIGVKVSFLQNFVTRGEGGVELGNSADAYFKIFVFEIFYTAITGSSISISGEAEVISSAYYFTGSGEITLSGEVRPVAPIWSYCGGEYPVVFRQIPAKVRVVQLNILDSLWLNTTGIIGDNPFISTFSAVSNGVLSSYLVLSEFNNRNIPSDYKMVGFNIELDRYASVGSIKDLGINLLDLEKIDLPSGDTVIEPDFVDSFISSNMAQPVTWPVGVVTPLNYLAGITPVKPNDFAALGELSDLFIDENTDYTLQENINKRNIGLAVRVYSSLPPDNSASIASAIFTIYAVSSDPNILHRVVVGGSADVLSSAWSWESQGGIVIGDTRADVSISMKFVANPTGIYPPQFPSIFMIGQYKLNLHYEAITEEIHLSGTADFVLQHYNYEASITDDLNFGGEAEWKASAWKYSPNFGIINPIDIQMGGQFAGRFNFVFETSCGALPFDPSCIEMFGNAKVLLNFSRDGGGSAVVSGSAGVISTAYSWEGSGGIVAGGNASNLTSNFEVRVDIGVFTSIKDISFIFAEENPPVIGNDTTTISMCGCSTLPLVMEMSQNISVGNKLSQFLTRNDFNMSERFDIRFNSTNNSWQSNFNFRGFSADANTQDLWNIVFELKCASNIGGTEFSTDYWVMAVSITQKNLVTLEDFDTKLFIVFDTDPFCIQGSDLIVNLSIDSQDDNPLTAAKILPPPNRNRQNAIVPNQFVLFDNIGLFKTPYWIKNPTIIIGISEQVATIAQTRLDLTNIRDRVLVLE